MNANERDELLIRIDERVKTLNKAVTDHLTKHETMNGASRKMLAMIIVAVISAVGSLVAALAK